MPKHFKLLLLLILLYSLFACGGEDPAGKLGVLEVAVTPAATIDIPVSGELVGQTLGSVDIAIRARVDGELEGLHFKEGEWVKKGQLLYSIDPRPLESRVVNQEGKLAEAATLLTKAESDLKRIEPLAKMNAVSKRELDAAVAQRDAAIASVESAKAQLEYVNIQLGYSKILSPIDGLIGISQAKVGDYVGKEPNPVVLNTISKIDPIHVRANINERDYLAFARRAAKDNQGQVGGKQKVKAEAKLELLLADGSLYEHKGSLYAVDSQIDSTTGTLTVEASFPNPEGILRPGQFAKIRYVKDIVKDALVVWQRAVQQLQNVYQVAIVNSENKVEIRQVKTGERIDGLWVIQEGISPGEKVIVAGQQKVRPEMIVVAKSPEELNVIPPDTPMAMALLKKTSTAAKSN